MRQLIKQISPAASEATFLRAVKMRIPVASWPVDMLQYFSGIQSTAAAAGNRRLVYLKHFNEAVFGDASIPTSARRLDS